MLPKPELIHKLLETVDVQYEALMALDTFGSSLSGFKSTVQTPFCLLSAHTKLMFCGDKVVLTPAMLLVVLEQNYCFTSTCISVQYFHSSEQ